MMLDFYNHKIKSSFIFLIITIIFLVSALKTEIGESHDSKYTVYTVEFDYFGMDAAKLEELITNPLEEKIMSMSGILEFKSTVEYSKSLTSLYFSKKENSKKNYLTIRNIVENLYNELPGDVQKPRIYSSDAVSKGILCVAFTGENVQLELRDWIEQNLKKQIEAIDGVSEVIIAGGSQREILVNFDPEKAAGTTQNPEDFASIIQDGNSENYQSSITTGNFKNYLTFDTKIHSLNDIKNLPINLDENIIKLKDIADIRMAQKEEDEIVTLDGEKCISVVVKSSSEGNSINISKECRKIFKDTNFGNYKYKFLYDTGEEQEKLIKSVLISLLESFIFIFLVVPFFFNSKRTSFIIFLLLPVSILWTIGILQLLNIAINQNIIAGITIALGLIVDPVLVISETAEQSESKEIFHVQMKKQFKVLISAAVTTLVAFIPLFFLDNIIAGVKNIAITITLMIVVALFIELIFVPCFIYKTRKTGIENRLSKKNQYFSNRIIYHLSCFGIKNRKLLTPIYWMLIFLPFLFLYKSGKSLSFENQSDIIYCSIDYEPEISNEYINSELIPFVYKLNENKFIKFVKTEINKGAVDIEIGYEKKSEKNNIAKYINSLRSYVQNGFLYVPGTENLKNNKHFSIEIAFSGDDSLKCREFAKQAAKLLSKNSIYSSVVLNFKNNESEYVFLPDRIKLGNNNLNVYSVGSTLRWFMYGPVADKWIEDGKEYDIRIAGKELNNATLKQVSSIFIPTQAGAVPLNSLGSIYKSTSAGKIYHKDSRRTAYITVESDNSSLDSAINTIRKDLSQITFDKGYTYSFSHELSRIKVNYNLLIFAFFFSITEILLVLLFLTENLKKSFITISTISSSIFLPLFIKIISNNPIQLGDVVGIIILSGISVNNIIYILESSCTSVIFKVRNKSKSIIVSSLTTILSSIPLLFMTTNSFCKQIAFFMVLGMINSLICSLILIPAVISENKKSE